VEAVEFNQLFAEFEQLGIRVVGTSTDPLERLQRFRDKHELRFPLLTDFDKEIGRTYGTLKSSGATHERDTVLIGKEGIVVAVYQKVHAKGHAAQVLADARRLRGEARL
jgi:peroxiredoxin Q/BCP